MNNKFTAQERRQFAIEWEEARQKVLARPELLGIRIVCEDSWKQEWEEARQAVLAHPELLDIKISCVDGDHQVMPGDSVPAGSAVEIKNIQSGAKRAS